MYHRTHLTLCSFPISCLLVVSAALFPSVAFASFVNVTVDDTYGDPLTGAQILYGPQAQWHTGQTCKECSAQPDPSQAGHGSWHDNTFYGALDNSSGSPPTATLLFEGIAVFVYCIITHSGQELWGNSHLSFYLGDELVGSFVDRSTGDDSYQYNRLVYANQSLSEGKHTLRIVNGEQNMDEKSLMLLDYIVYTRENPAGTYDISTLPAPTSTESQSQSLISAQSSQSVSLPLSATKPPPVPPESSTRNIVISVASSVCGTLLVTLSVLWLYKRGQARRAQQEFERKKEAENSYDDTPYGKGYRISGTTFRAEH